MRTTLGKNAVRISYFPHPAIRKTLAQEGEIAPALLTSFVFLKEFQKDREKLIFRDWVLDSGAFSAHVSGKKIDLQAYGETCLELLATDKTLTEVFSLDIIGDWRASEKNTERLWNMGIPAIPCYHINEPEDVLIALARDYPKIAIGGVARVKGSLKKKFAEQCFARVWPKPIHGFGFGAKEMILSLPFHSVDASNWALGPCGFGRWVSFGGYVPTWGAKNLRPEVDHFLRIERQARDKWKRELLELENLLAKGASPRPARQTPGRGKRK